VGGVINLDGQTFTVVGVMPRGFAFPNDDTQLWVPLGEALRSAPQLEFNRQFYAFESVARLAAGATLAQARADVGLVAQRISAAEAFGVDPLKVEDVEDVRSALLVLFGAVGLVLLIACANAAGLYVARATGRRKEIAVRRALGADRGRLVRQLLTESVVVALIAGAAGVLAARWGLTAVLAVWPRVPRVNEIGIDPWVLGFALVVSLVTGLAFGLLPALRAAAPGVEEVLRDEGGATTGSRRRHRTHSGLVVAEIALALVLLVGSGLLIRSFVRLTSVDPGYDTHDVLAARIRLTPSRYADPTVQNQFFQNLTDLLARNPGVADVSVSRTLPLTSGLDILAFDPRRMRADATEEFLATRPSVVGPGYFAAMGIPLRGRDFTPQDRADAPKVVIMNRRLSGELWPGQDPVGKVFRPGRGGYEATVIGTIGDIRYASLDATPMFELYFPQLQAAAGAARRPGGVPEMWVVLKAKRSPLALAGAVRDAVLQLDPQQPIGDLVSLDQALSRSTAARRLSMTLLTLFAALAVVLALIGIYGITAYAVTQRTRELGLRIAIGARPAEVVGLLLKENLGLVLGGIVLGAVGAALATRALRTMLFGVSTLDAITFIGAALVLGGVAMLATYVPARRAARIDPMEALRSE
jgi:putative ABC transport system permease protein